ncbi:hypothetical protein GCM10010260_82950 [Streptomyces filipinensis]|uniref:Uncharacterized protein n=1 Tax=Streptomyces filipinensis TaxID=66887 RepID=A0A918ILM6_9ACTN|nr:hypothetical protein [Streptomyces filipinensis]GGV29799.1 hypothetical protein GCM10010260_82950 [Streptomyces filipinensis]
MASRPLVDQLVWGGYLLRETAPAGRRPARLRLTEAARKRLGERQRRRAELSDRHVSRLGGADREALRGPPGPAQAGRRPAR